MKVKTSISLSPEILEKVQTLAPEGNRSEFIESAIWYYLDILQREARNKKDLEILNDAASTLNSEANDSLEYQAPL